MTYGEYRRRQREHEKRCWEEASPEERQQRLEMRRQYLFAMAFVHEDWLDDLIECPACTPGIVLLTRYWPAFFLCLNCDCICVLDYNSHLVCDGQERLFIEPRASLGDRYKCYRRREAEPKVGGA
jgi:hypothetical protein